jgi:hypothetical protein
MIKYSFKPILTKTVFIFYAGGDFKDHWVRRIPFYGHKKAGINPGKRVAFKSHRISKDGNSPEKYWTC